MNAPFRVLALSGSLRRGSSNTAALDAMARLAAKDVLVELYDGLRTVPPFDPDIDATPPAAVADLKARLKAADALVISSPEYARGIAGSLKNALDWLVSGDEVPGKPVALINTAPRAVHAQAALRLTLETMSARIVESACVTVPLLGRTLDPAAIADDPLLAPALRGVLQALREQARTGR